jgi:predicted transcriptional regulator of viral defense system
MEERGRENEKYKRFLDQVHAVDALARAQHLVFSLDQLLDAGVSARAAQQRVQARRFYRLYPTVYSLVPANLLSKEGRWLAAVLACGPGAVLSHISAAWLHELRRSDSALIDVTVPARSSRRHPGIRIHRSTTLTEADVTTVSNIPCTTVARTQLDVAEVINRRGLERLFDQAAIIEVFDLRALEDQLARNTKRRGAKVIRAVLAEHAVGSTLTETEIEERFLGATRSAGMPDPEVQKYLELNDGGDPIRADFLWREQRIVVETDSLRFHRTRASIERDTERDQRLTVAGWRPVRFTWPQIEHRREVVTGRLRLMMQK